MSYEDLQKWKIGNTLYTPSRNPTTPQGLRRSKLKTLSNKRHTKSERNPEIAITFLSPLPSGKLNCSHLGRAASSFLIWGTELWPTRVPNLDIIFSHVWYTPSPPEQFPTIMSVFGLNTKCLNDTCILVQSYIPIIWRGGGADFWILSIFNYDHLGCKAKSAWSGTKCQWVCLRDQKGFEPCFTIPPVSLLERPKRVSAMFCYNASLCKFHLYSLCSDLVWPGLMRRPNVLCPI